MCASLFPHPLMVRGGHVESFGDLCGIGNLACWGPSAVSKIMTKNNNYIDYNINSACGKREVQTKLVHGNPFV